MNIQQVKIKEFKVLKDIEANINGSNILLIGDNGVGKSSFIQFIEIALGKSTNIPQAASGEGFVVTNKDGLQYTFHVKFKDGKPVVTITSPTGLKDSRKSALANLVGAVDFDVNEFVELSKTKAGQKKQVEIFKSFLSKDIVEELNRMEAHIKSIYDERTECNRALKETEAFVNNHPLRFDDLKGLFFTDTNNLMSELNKLNAANEQIKTQIQKKEENEKAIAAEKLQLTELKEKIAALEISISEKEAKSVAAENWLSKNKIQSTEVLQNQISSAAQNNKKFEEAKQLSEKRELLNKLNEEVGEFTARIEAERQCISDTIKQMEVPVSGLSFEDDVLTYNGIPVSPDNLSTSEIIELGVKLKMAENKDLGILFIQNGESIGTERLKLIQELAAKENWQIIMEQVERGRDFEIELMQAD